MKVRTFSVLISLLVSSQFLNAMILNDSIPSGENYETAKFKLWYPDDLRVINGIIILVPGSNGDGRDQVSDSEWQELAKKHGFALLGCYYKDYKNSFVEKYVDVSKGSGQALLEVINKFSKSSGHSELEFSPLLLWGTSAGGQFNYEFACWHPERIIAFVVNKGGVYYTALAPEETRMVPGVFFVGEQDIEARNDIVKGLFSMNRRAGALWTYALEPYTAHEFEHSKKFTITYFEEIIPLRLPDNQQPVRTIVLNALKEEIGFIGDHKKKEIMPVSKAQEYNYPVSWLTGKKTAEAWISLITNSDF